MLCSSALLWPPAAGIKWLLLSMFRQRLSFNIRQQMAIYNEFVVLENFIQKACTMDLPAASPPPSSPSSTPPPSEPMQIDSYQLTHVECQQRINNGLLYCGAEGHLMSACPVHPPRLTDYPSTTQPRVGNLSLTIKYLHYPRKPAQQR